jgi:hypothetical protein
MKFVMNYINANEICFTVSYLLGRIRDENGQIYRTPTFRVHLIYFRIAALQRKHLNANKYNSGTRTIAK